MYNYEHCSNVFNGQKKNNDGGQKNFKSNIEEKQYKWNISTPF